MREAPGCWGDGELLILDEGCSSQLHSMACRVNAWHHGPGENALPDTVEWVCRTEEGAPTYLLPKLCCVVLCECHHSRMDITRALTQSVGERACIRHVWVQIPDVVLWSSQLCNGMRGPRFPHLLNGHCLESTRQRWEAAMSTCCMLVHTTFLEPQSPSKATTENCPGLTWDSELSCLPPCPAHSGVCFVSVHLSICGVSSLQLLLIWRRASALTLRG